MSKLKQYIDLRLLDNRWIIHKIRHEHANQIAKWGVQTHSAFEWLTYTAEELGSLAKAIGEHEYRGGPKERIVSEAIQVATLALKIAEMFENTGETR
jgi:hypothetical protein